MTSNLPFSEWTQVIPNARLCKALIDRIADRAHIIETGAESYRFRRTLEKRKGRTSLANTTSAPPLAEIARRERIARRYVERLSRLAFVAPAIVEAIGRGQRPAELSAETLLNRIDLPLLWSEQLKALGIN